MEKKSLILTGIRLALLGLWMPVAVDKLWNLSRFHSTLLRQPFPDWWADVLFWLLPVLELLAAVLVAWPYGSRHAELLPQEVADSASLTKSAKSPTPLHTRPIPHTVTSTVGQRKPVGSGEVSSSITRLGLWLSTILIFAFTLFILFGVLGWYDKRPCGCGSVISGLTWEQHLWFNITFLLLSAVGLWLTRDKKHQTPPSNLSSRRREGSPYKSFPNYTLLITLFKTRFPRKFAVFRRGAVGTSKKGGGNLKQASPTDDGSLHACRR